MGGATICITPSPPNTFVRHDAMMKWHTVLVRPGFNGFGDIDPYIDWAFGPRAITPRFLDRKRPFPLLIQLRNNVTCAKFADGSFFGETAAPKDWGRHVRVPAINLQTDALTMQLSYFTTLVTEDFFGYFDDRVLGPRLRNAIARMCLSGALLPGTFPDKGPEQSLPQDAPKGDPEAGTVVMGIIDDGIAFANEQFRTNENRTRVEFVWLQDGEHNSAASRYGYGRSLSKYDGDGVPGIDTLLREATHNGLVDEEDVYTKSGAVNLARAHKAIFRTVRLRSSHGTHVMDIACGYPPGEAPKNNYAKGEDNRPIVCVQLPAATQEGTSGASLDTSVVDGIRYILDKADEIARRRGCGPLPVVINFSYGTVAGRHDGTSDAERAIDALIMARSRQAPLQIVIPAGNSRLNRCHAQLSFRRKRSFLSKGSVRQLRWRVLPDDRTTNYLEVWLPRSGPISRRRVKLSVLPPIGQRSPTLEEQAQSVMVWGESPEQGVCEIRYCRVPEPTNRGMFLISIKPTTPVEDPDTGDLDGSVAQPGLWTIQLENVSLEANEVVHAWVQRNDTRYGYPVLGRQSYLEDNEYVRFGNDGKVPKHDRTESQVKRAGTLNGIATGGHTIVIGGFRRQDLLPVDFSGEGPANEINRHGPDALAITDDSIVHRGILASGTKSGSVVALEGTSAAAPQIARLVACLLAEGKSADRDAIRALAQEEENAHHNSRPPQPPRERGGGGRIERPPVVRLPR